MFKNMKKNVFFALLLTIAVMAFFASCLKETAPVEPPVQTENQITSDESVSDRACSQTVTINGALGMHLCGNIPNYPGSNCTGCGSSYGRFYIDYNSLTTTMIGTSFSLTNPTNTTKSVNFLIASGGVAQCISLNFSFPPNTTKSFEIYQYSKTCCTVREVECE